VHEHKIWNEQLANRISHSVNFVHYSETSAYAEQYGAAAAVGYFLGGNLAKLIFLGLSIYLIKEGSIDIKKEVSIDELGGELPPQPDK